MITVDSALWAGNAMTPDDQTLKLFRDGLPYVTTVFDTYDDQVVNQLYLSILRRNLKKVVPESFFCERLQRGDSLDQIFKGFHDKLPLLTHSPLGKPPFDISFYLLSRYRVNVFKFFLEMVSRWLVPGKQLKGELFYGTDFRIPDLSDDMYTLCDLVFRVETEQDLWVLKRHLPIIETELCLGAHSPYFAQRILDTKGLTADEKTSMVQQHVARLAKRLPHAFGDDIFSRMQQILVICRDDFKAEREYKHLSRIITVKYLFWRELFQSIEKNPEKRRIFLKLFKARIHPKDGLKTVLCIVVGLNFLNRNEYYDEPHLLKAVRRIIPNVKALDDTFLSRYYRMKRFFTLYIEVEKEDGSDFTCREMQMLHNGLMHDLPNTVEHMMHPIFMPPNEEETMRDILTLSNQIRFVRDLPQVIVNFQEQTDSEVVFTVIIVRVVRGQSASIPDLFMRVCKRLNYHHDRTKTVGYLRKKYPKEATVFRLSLPKVDFLRSDHSLDLQKARQSVVTELIQVIGEFRDYNGGMISKQSEAFGVLKRHLAEVGRENDFLLEDFFYSLVPSVLRSVLDPDVLKSFFLMLHDAIRDRLAKEDSYELKIQEEPELFFAVMTFEEAVNQEEIIAAIAPLSIPSIELAKTVVNVYGIPCLGFIYRCDDLKKRQAFHDAVEGGLVRLRAVVRVH